MAILLDRINGQNYADNVVDPILFFDTGTWTTVSGTGTALLNTENPYVGSSSLKVENNVPASSYLVSNSSQSTIANYNGTFKISWFAKKTISGEVVNASVLIYRNGVLLQTESFSIGSISVDLDKTNTLQRFQADLDISVAQGDEVTFQFRIDPSTTAQATTFLYFDGFMVNEGDRDNTIVPAYNKPDTLTLEDTIQKLYDAPGWGYYRDGETITPTEIFDQTPKQLLIDNTSSLTNTAYLPHEIRGISDLWSQNDNKITPIGLGDSYEVRIEIGITAVISNPTRFNIALDIGTVQDGTGVGNSVLVVQDSRTLKTGVPQNHTVSFPIFSLASFTANGGSLWIDVDNGSIEVVKRSIFISRTSKGDL